MDTGNLDAALRYLLSLINDSGWEYPDAHCRAAWRYQVDADELQRAYDDHCANKQ